MARVEDLNAPPPAPERMRALFLISPSQCPCGVETFARRQSNAFAAGGRGRENLAVSGAPGDAVAIWRALAENDAIVMNFPVVAWKKALATPLIACILAALRGKKRVLVFHEWGDLDWRRRAFLLLYSAFASHIQFSSPAVRAQFLRSAASWGLGAKSSVVTIPANFKPFAAPASTPQSERVKAAKADGALILGYFGAIYPKKQADFALDVAAALKRDGHKVFTVFIGSFVKGLDRVDEEFNEKAARLGVGDDAFVTGYIRTDEEIAGLFQYVDCFVYRFAEGLTSRRGSVLACVAQGCKLLVNAPRETDEFAHHRLYRAALESGAITLTTSDADAETYARKVLELAKAPPVAPVSAEEVDACWRDVARALEKSLA